MKEGCDSNSRGRKIRKELPILGTGGDMRPSIRHSRMAKWRAGSLILLHLLMAAHIIHWLWNGRTISPIEPSEAMYTLQNGAVNAGFIFFTIAILATLLLGRFVCGWACHVVALQDLCAWILRKAGLRPRPFRSRLLIYVPLIAALYMFVWPTVSRALTKPASEPLFPHFTNHLTTTEFWATFPTIAVAIPFLFICGFVVVYFLGMKGFCTYGCPYGGFFAIADRFAPGRIRVTDACNNCGHCTSVCTSNVKVHSEVKNYGMIVDPGCMKCMDCVTVCPNDALYYGFGKTAIARQEPPNVQKMGYSLTWSEEILGIIIFFASLFAVWNVYQLVPMLMAIGIAIVSTFLGLKLLKLVRSPDQTFYGKSLRSSGRFTFRGRMFAAFAILWLAAVAHSGYIRYHESAGARAFENIAIPDELALATSDPSRWLSAIDRGNIQNGRYHLHRSMKAGFFTNVDAIPKLAWMEYLSGDIETAAELLGRSGAWSTGRQRTLSLYYRGAILNRAGRAEEALISLTSALDTSPDLATGYEELGESFWRLGRKEEAEAAWQEAVKKGSGLPLANNFLAGAAEARGKTDMALTFERRAEQFTPRDARFRWMLGMRLKNLGMDRIAEKQFSEARKLDPGLGQ